MRHIGFFDVYRVKNFDILKKENLKEFEKLIHSCRTDNQDIKTKPLIEQEKLREVANIWDMPVFIIEKNVQDFWPNQIIDIVDLRSFEEPPKRFKIVGWISRGKNGELVQNIFTPAADGEFLIYTLSNEGTESKIYDKYEKISECYIKYL